MKSRAGFALVVVGAVVLSWAGCGGTVVFEEDGQSGDGGNGNGGAPTTTHASTSGNPTTTSGNPTSASGNPTTTSGNPTSASGNPTSASGNPTTTSVVGPAPVSVSASSGVSECEGVLFSDPQLDQCSRQSCCSQMGRCLDDPASCFDQQGQLMPSPNGNELFDCLQGSFCLPELPPICESGLQFGDTTIETYALAGCLSDNCCAEFNFCSSDGNDVDTCIDCLNGNVKDQDLCRPALDCAADFCQPLR